MSTLPFATASVLALTLTAEAPPPAGDERHNSFIYRPPDKPPKGPRTHYVEAPPDWLLDHMATNLSKLGLTVEPRQPGQRRLVARYSGDPREFIDCGEVEMLVDGKRLRPPKQYSANRPETRTYRIVQGHRIGLLRETRLDAHVVIEAEALGRSTRVSTNVIYVVTKSVSRIYKGGEAGEVLDHEVMSFTSSGIGRFKKGTSCVATGKLEDLSTVPFKKSANGDA
jgi:hypothetical protein